MGIEEFGAIAIAITIIGAVIVFFKQLKRICVRVWHFVSRSKPKVPRETIRIVNKINSCYWSEGTVDGKPAMYVVGTWNVTNIIDTPVRLLSARLSKPSTVGHIMTLSGSRNIWGRYEILPNSTTEVTGDFLVIPPKCSIGVDFKSTVFLTDQYGNDHKIKDVIFNGRQPNSPKDDGISQESTYTISDPIEKEIVSVLKSEVYRYKNCGRRVGGLGSIRTTICGDTFVGIGPESGKMDSPENQLIVENDKEVSIVSDNALALLKLYERLLDDNEKDRFCKVLLLRVSRGTEYSSIGYFIFYVMFCIGKLGNVLEKAKLDLYEDEKHGFSNILMLLGGLLRLKHSSFSSEMMDEIERFTDGIDEHLFKIPERLSAIRTYRLYKQD